MSVSPEALRDLANRCESEQPSWELSIAIALAIDPDAKGAAFYNPPAYVHSLDAAVTLVPWVLLSLSDIGPNGMFYCRLGETEAPCREAVSEGARTLVLALCAAALRARAALAKDGSASPATRSDSTTESEG